MYLSMANLPFMGDNTASSACYTKGSLCSDGEQLSDRQRIVHHLASMGMVIMKPL